MQRYRTIKICDMAEASLIKNEVLKFINEKMSGIDIGTQGMPIFDNVISVDKYLHEKGVVHLKGDARKLNWFKDNVLDYVFSSHCYEDITLEEKPAVLREWARVIHTNGYLLLYLPDECAYRAYCKKVGSAHNSAHKDINFGIQTVRDIVKNHCSNILKEIYAIEKHASYSFFLVYRKL